MEELMRVEGLTLQVPDKKNQKQWMTAAEDVSFSIETGEILGIVGESGSGKSVTVLSLMGLNSEETRREKGSVYYGGRDLCLLSEREWQKLRGSELSMIFQEPMTSLNPVMRVGEQVEEMLALHGEVPGELRKDRVLEIFHEVGLKDPENVYRQYPHRLSGGMQQRVMIGMAMICRPRLLIADEPTTALDAAVQDQILMLMKRLNEEYGVSILLISHDLRVIRQICDHVLVMKDGVIVERGAMETVFRHPGHPYTKKLLEAVPKGSREQFLDRRKEAEQLQPPVLEAADLCHSFHKHGQKLLGKKERKQILEGVSFTIRKGEFAGLVGESGCGKTTLCKLIAGLLKPDSGTLHLWNGAPEGQRTAGKVSMVFQNPYSSLNPARKVGWIMEEPLKIAGGYTRAEREQAVYEMLQKVGLGEELKNARISQLSGGQRQRVAIGLALMEKPDLVILDEPVSALDVTIQAQILELLGRLQKEMGLTFLFISHDMNVVYEVCSRIFQMKHRTVREIKE